MDNILEKRLLSISQSLKSNSRSTGPRLYNKYLGYVVGGNDNRDSDFADRIIDIFYNIRFIYVFFGIILFYIMFY